LDAKITQKKTELEKLVEEKVKGVIIRSRARWYEHGEKPTKHIFYLEKRNYNRKCINKLISSAGKEVTEPKEILAEESKFFKKLYTSQHINVAEEKIYYFLQENTILSETDKMSMEGPVTDYEVVNVIKSMANNKSPGSDGLPVEFYKIFWKDIKVDLMNAILEAYELGELPILQKHGVLTLLPKKKDPFYLKNWRPLSLLKEKTSMMISVYTGKSVISVNSEGLSLYHTCTVKARFDQKNVLH